MTDVTVQELQTELLPAVPLLRWVFPEDEVFHYFTVGSEQGGSSGTWQFERSAGNVPLQELSGTLPVSCFTNGYDYYLSTSSTPPDSSWTVVEQTPWYIFDPSLPPPPGTVEFDCYTNGGHYFYTADPEIEALSGWTKGATLGYVYKVPMAVYRWNNNGYHFLSTDPNASVPEGFTLEGQKFYAFVNPAPQTIPVYSYTGIGNAHDNIQDQYFDVIPNHQRTGWTQDPGPAFYAYPAGSPFYGSVALQHYQCATSNFFTAEPSSEVLNGYTYCDNLIQVFPPTDDGKPPTITTNILAGTLTTGSSSPNGARSLTADTQYMECDSHWYGILFTLSHQAVDDVEDGVNVAAAITAAVGAAISPGSPPAAAIVGVVASYLWGMASVLSAVDRGNGIYLLIPWSIIGTVVEPALIFVSIIPWPR